MKQLYIFGEKTLFEINEEFQQVYPHLKLKFFRLHHEPQEGSESSAKIPYTIKISRVSQHFQNGHIGINGNKKVSSFEKEFEKKYGVPVQVYRRSGHTWLQTINTDSWSLYEQNEEGSEGAVIQTDQPKGYYDAEMFE